MGSNFTSPAQNVYAPPSYIGVPNSKVGNGIPSDFTYTYNVTLSANQLLTNDGTLIYTDADFFITGVLLALNTAAFQFQLSDASGYYLMNSMINSAALQIVTPFPFVPAVKIPAGGRIGINIQDLSGAANTIQLIYRGYKSFAVNA